MFVCNNLEFLQGLRANWMDWVLVDLDIDMAMGFCFLGKYVRHW